MFKNLVDCNFGKENDNKLQNAKISGFSKSVTCKQLF